jgi:hypothetical protein
MADATHTITNFRSPTEKGMRQHGAAVTQGSNPITLTPDFRNTGSGKPIYIYNVLPLEHKGINRSRPYTNVTIPACKDGEKVSSPFMIPEIVNVPRQSATSFEVQIQTEDGRRRAMDIINPANIGLNQDLSDEQLQRQTGDNFLDQEGNNLNNLGVFWSELGPDDPRLDEQVTKFKARAEKTLNSMINKAKIKEATGKIQDITPLERFAVAYFGITTSWNQVHEHKVTCPNCGDQIKQGVALHRNQFGDKCVLDWKRAYRTGGVKKDEVPEDFHEEVFGKAAPKTIK